MQAFLVKWVENNESGHFPSCMDSPPLSFRRISQSRESGRHLVASRDLAATELILRDAPTVVGPSRQQEHLVCVECFW